MPEHATYARSIPGVLFIEDFDAVDADQSRPAMGVPVIRPEKDQPAPDPIDVETIRMMSFQEGFEAGRKTAEEGLFSARNDLLKRIDSQLERAQEDMAQNIERGMTAVADSVFALLTQLIPVFCQSHGEEEMRSALRGMLPDLPNDMQLTISVHPSLTDAAQEECSRVRRSVPVTVEPREDLMAGDVEVVWQNGMIARDMNKVSRAVITSLIKIGLLRYED